MPRFARNLGATLGSDASQGRLPAMTQQANVSGVRSDPSHKVERLRVANRSWVRVVVSAVRPNGRNEQRPA